MRYAISHKAKGGLSWTDFWVKEKRIRVRAAKFGDAKRMRHVTIWVWAEIKRRLPKVAAQVFTGRVYIELVRAMG